MGATREKWTRVSKRNRCPICDSDHWCTISPDGEVCHCMRVEAGSVKRTGAGGFIHRLNGSRSPLSIDDHWRTGRVASQAGDRRSFPPSGFARAKNSTGSVPSVKPESVDFEAFFRKSFERAENGLRSKLAALLSVPEPMLRLLGVGWDGACWTFPMQLAGRVVGITRRPPTGRKRSVVGSHWGHYCPVDAPVGREDPLLIVEGPTDCAAAMAMGYAAIGRPSCRGLVQETVSVARGRAVVVVGDPDPPKGPQNRSPGREGAEELAMALVRPCRSVRVVYPPAQDLRDWYAAGGRRRDFERLAAATRPIGAW